jgi:hypothetical protein
VQLFDELGNVEAVKYEKSTWSEVEEMYNISVSTYRYAHL